MSHNWCGVRVVVVEVADLDLHLAVRACEEDVGGTEVSVFHVVDVQVTQTVFNGQGDVELGVETVRLSRGHVFLQRNMHRFHADVATDNVNDEDAQKFGCE
jgi:hypothetical protein